MGRNAKNKALKLGFKNFPLTTLYARPRNLRVMFSKAKPDTADKIGDYMRSIDPTFIEANSGGGRNNTFYLLAEQAKLYVELADRLAAFYAWDTANHVEKIDIYTENQAHVRKIAQNINNIWDDGILPHMEWDKINKKYKMNKEDCIAMWNKYLSDGAENSTATEQVYEFKICEKCGKQNLVANKFCVECGEKF